MKIMQLLSPFERSLGMYSGHEAQLFKLQEKFGGKIRSPSFCCISLANMKTFKSLIPEHTFFIEINMVISLEENKFLSFSLSTVPVLCY